MNISYKQKYLKYKNKYLQLKGGASAASAQIDEDHKVFYLYVTGIAEYLNYWTTFLKFRILECIPSTIFSRVEIIYYDPINYGRRTERYDVEIAEKLIELAPRLLNLDENFDGMHIKGTFIQDFFPINHIIKNLPKHYLIFDCAHIFNYMKKRDGLLDRNNFWYEDKKKRKIIVQVPLNVLYLGWLAQEETWGGYNNRSITETNFLTITKDEVITWVDVLTMMGYKLDEHFVTEIFSRPIGKFIQFKKTLLYAEVRKMEPGPARLKLFDEIDSRLNSNEVSRRITYMLIAHVFTGYYTEEQLIEYLKTTVDFI